MAQIRDLFFVKYKKKKKTKTTTPESRVELEQTLKSKYSALSENGVKRGVGNAYFYLTYPHRVVQSTKRVRRYFASEQFEDTFTIFTRKHNEVFSC